MAQSIALQTAVDQDFYVAETNQQAAVREFLASADELTNEELNLLAEECDSETTDTHCVYCSAWSVLIGREN